eukprot:TRINITY_DN12189_c0_g2_i1.p1 TRINITY_DN12189_c0_g2~~TRINITY_DN12189_c0_g2_i1.p1  ORF type:complete len:116 (-),score=13.86 TRINITY_DN12189_c0_g2_i1:4-351(-)
MTSLLTTPLHLIPGISTVNRSTSDSVESVERLENARIIAQTNKNEKIDQEIYRMRSWLRDMKLPETYINILVNDGFDDLESLALATDQDLLALGITKTGHRRKITHGIKQTLGYT